MDTLKNDATMEETLEFINAYEKLEVYNGYCVADLHRIFDKVANPKDWKAPIYAECGGEAVMALVAAIQFYTATTPQVTLDVTQMRYYVTSVGYRNGPAGDH